VAGRPGPHHQAPLESSATATSRSSQPSATWCEMMVAGHGVRARLQGRAVASRPWGKEAGSLVAVGKLTAREV
ncbi:MAG: hypothetical protein M0027_06455, partial [Candidatus Dormibacteraeota bacterium]|nr:hypothetical protein [Candidatus Dormibacteraeota bacterium]